MRPLVVQSSSHGVVLGLDGPDRVGMIAGIESVCVAVCAVASCDMARTKRASRANILLLSWFEHLLMAEQRISRGLDEPRRREITQKALSNARNDVATGDASEKHAPRVLANAALK